jgi:hypothetical protein
MTRRAYHDKEQRTDMVVRFASADDLFELVAEGLGDGEPLNVVEDDSSVVWVHGEGVFGGRV